MKKAVKFIAGTLFTIVILTVVFWGSIVYVTEYQKTVCATEVSPNGIYELELISVGEPDWPFGLTKGSLVLKSDGKKIDQADFELRNDGKMISESCWKVIWREACAEVILSGEEQQDQTIILYFKKKSLIPVTVEVRLL